MAGIHKVRQMAGPALTRGLTQWPIVTMLRKGRFEHGSYVPFKLL